MELPSENVDGVTDEEEFAPCGNFLMLCMLASSFWHCVYVCDGGHNWSFFDHVMSSANCSRQRHSITRNALTVNLRHEPKILCADDTTPL